MKWFKEMNIYVNRDLFKSIIKKPDFISHLFLFLRQDKWDGYYIEF